MLVEQFARALCALFIGHALGPVSAEPRTIGLGVLCRLLALAALLETFEIEHFPHHHPSCNGFGSRDNSKKIRVLRKATTRTGQTGIHF
jgi:hypothetical protein